MNKTPSLPKSQDPTLQALDDMLASPFFLAILLQDTLLHFMLPKFQMYDGFDDPFDHLMHFR